MSLHELTTRKGHGILAAEVIAGSGLIAFANHKYGAGEIKLGTAANGSGGVPLDGALGLAGIAYAFWKPTSKFAIHALGLGLGFGAGFAYRTGAAMGDRSAATATATAHTTAGHSLAAAPAVRQLGQGTVAGLSSFARPRVAAGVSR